MSEIEMLYYHLEPPMHEIVLKDVRHITHIPDLNNTIGKY